MQEPGKRQPAGRDGSVAERTHRARAIAPDKPADRGIEASAGFNPVRYARTVKPRYPATARRAGWQGTTVLKVRVDSQGAPDRVTVDRTSGFDILDAAAVKAMGRWRFHPARRGNHRVAAWVRIPVTFKLKEDKR